MQKDLKIGMALGLVLVASAAIWLSTRPGLSIKARILSSPPEATVLARDVESTVEATKKPPAPLIVTTPVAAPQPAANNEPVLSEFILSGVEVVEGQQTTKLHIVRRGETLSGISYQYYGTANKWQKIFDANRRRLKDPNTLTPGTRLTIPE